jgi:hypothetical protein
MNPNPRIGKTISAALWVALGMITTLCCATPAHAQLNGENLLGDMGVKSGTQPESGLYVSTIYYRYFTDTIKDPEGNPLALDPSGTANQTIHAAMPLVLYVTPKKVLGAHFGMMAVLPFGSGSLEAPGLGLAEDASPGLSDLYVMPAQLGWHFTRADAVAGVGFFAPTGRYSAGASDNLGKGMWSYEISVGGTLYLDSQRSFSLSTTAFWETHGAKEGAVHVQNVSLSHARVGRLMTLEGGIGKSFLRGAASVGGAYYAQWKITPDQFETSPGVMEPASIQAKHRVWGVGPEVPIPIATKTKLVSLVNVRYMWEQGARLKTQGQTFIITNTIPVGGIRIPARN